MEPSSASWYQQNEPLLNPETCQTTFSFTERPITTSARNGRAIAVNTINSDAALDVVTGFSFEVAWHEGFVAEECVTFDVTGDGEMDGAELSQMAGAFGLRCEEETNPVIIAWCESVDYDQNQEVDGNDLSILTSTGVWGRCIDEDIKICALEDQCSFTCP